MSNGYYSHQKHIFDNPYSNNVYIDPPQGKTLIIDATIANPVAVGIDGSVQFNSLGNPAGDSTFLYDTINTELTIPNVKTDYVFSSKSSDVLGYSTIYQGTGQTFPQTITSQYALLSNFGTDLQVAKSANYAAFACPNPGAGFPDPTEGGVTVFSQAVIDNPWAEYSSVLGYTGITDENFTSVGINEAGDKLALADRSAAGNIKVYDRSGATWTSVAEVSLNSQAVKITGSGTLLTCNSLSQYSVYTQSGASITLAQNLVDLAVAFSETACLSIHGSVLAFTHAGDLWCYTNSGTWSLSFTKSSAAYQSIDIYNTSGTNSLLVVVTPSALIAYENGSVALNDVDTWDCVCTNGTYIFAFGSGSISIFSKVLGVWTKMTQTYSLAGITKMSANAEYLAVSRSAINSGTIFKIETYTNSTVTITEIDLNEADNKLHITAGYGVDFGATTTVTIPALNSTTATIDGRIILPAGGLTDPAIQFSGTDTGFFYEANQVNTCVNGVNKLAVTGTNINCIDQLRTSSNGTAGIPSLSFISDTNTGIYRIGADNLGISCNGVKQVDVSTTRVTTTGPILTSAGTAALPGLAVGYNNVGMYSFGSSLGFSVAGVSQLTTDAIHTVSSNQFKTLGDGSVSAPSFSWVNSGNSGMYYTTNEIDFAIAGTKRCAITTSAIQSNNLIGLNTPTTTLNMDTTIQFGLGGSFLQRMGSAGNSLAEASFGNGCSLVSNNPTLGSVVRVNATGPGKWGTENIVSGSATQFHLFLADTSGTGSITTNGTTTSYNTTSDHRLKENVLPLTNQLDRIDLLQPVSYNWINSTNKGEGFLAFQLQEVFPEAVYGVKDGVDADGKIIPQAIDTSFLIGSLVSCIKELKEEIRLIKAELATFV